MGWFVGQKNKPGDGEEGTRGNVKWISARTTLIKWDRQGTGNGNGKIAIGIFIAGGVHVRKKVRGTLNHKSKPNEPLLGNASGKIGENRGE